MHLHEELRAARLAAGLTQTELAARSGVPRNQVVRAERGGNITLLTLRKLAAHLPIESLNLLEKLRLDFNYVPQPEKLYFDALNTVGQTAETLRYAIQTVMTAREALATARRAELSPAEAEAEAVILYAMARNIEDIVAPLKVLT